MGRKSVKFSFSNYPGCSTCEALILQRNLQAGQSHSQAGYQFESFGDRSSRSQSSHKDSHHWVRAAGLRAENAGFRGEEKVTHDRTRARSMSDGERLMMKTRRGRGETGIKKQEGITKEGERREREEWGI